MLWELYHDTSRIVQWFVVKRIMCYLKGTSDHGLLYKRRQNLNFLPKINVTCHGFIMSHLGSHLSLGNDIDTKKICIWIRFYFIFRSCKLEQQKENNNCLIFFLK